MANPSPSLREATEAELGDQLGVLVGGALGVASAASAALSWTLLQEPVAAAIATVGVANSALLWWAARTGVTTPDRIVLHLGVYGLLGAGFYAVLSHGVVTLALPGLLLLVAALIHNRRALRLLAGFLVAVHLLATVGRSHMLDLPASDGALVAIVPPILLLVLLRVVELLLERQEARSDLLHHRLAEIEATIPAVDALARGNLTYEAVGDGPLPEATRRTRRELSALATELRASVAVLRSVAGVVDRTSVQRSQRTERLVASIAEIHDAQERLLDQARRVAEIAAGVAQQSSESKRSTDESTERLLALTATARKVATHHSAIRQIAAKSEILAVNAAIEAVHAGEAGRAFSAVAARLQALAEGVREQLVTAEALNDALLGAAKEAQQASARSSQSTAESLGAATEIADTAAQQLEATERFGRAIGDIESFAEQLKRDSADGREHAGRVVDVATQLAQGVDRFKTADP